MLIKLNYIKLNTLKSGYVWWFLSGFFTLWFCMVLYQRLVGRIMLYHAWFKNFVMLFSRFRNVFQSESILKWFFITICNYLTSWQKPNHRCSSLFIPCCTRDKNKLTHRSHPAPSIWLRKQLSRPHAKTI